MKRAVRTALTDQKVKENRRLEVKAERRDDIEK